MSELNKIVKEHEAWWCKISNNIKTKLLLQEKFCKDHELPHFAPYDGVCFRCNYQIYERISIHQAMNTLITGCPFCHWSYCE